MSRIDLTVLPAGVLADTCRRKNQRLQSPKAGLNFERYVKNVRQAVRALPGDRIKLQFFLEPDGELTVEAAPRMAEDVQAKGYIEAVLPALRAHLTYDTGKKLQFFASAERVAAHQGDHAPLSLLQLRQLFAMIQYFLIKGDLQEGIDIRIAYDRRSNDYDFSFAHSPVTLTDEEQACLRRDMRILLDMVKHGRPDRFMQRAAYCMAKAEIYSDDKAVVTSRSNNLNLRCLARSTFTPDRAPEATLMMRQTFKLFAECFPDIYLQFFKSPTGNLAAFIDPLALTPAGGEPTAEQFSRMRLALATIQASIRSLQLPAPTSRSARFAAPDLVSPVPSSVSSKAPSPLLLASSGVRRGMGVGKHAEMESKSERPPVATEALTLGSA